MAKKQFFFIITCLTVVMGMVGLYAVLNRHFSMRPDYVATIERLQTELESEKLRSSNLAYQLQDYRQAVALALPKRGDLQETSDLIRGLASVSQVNSGDAKVDFSTALLQKGKNLFQKKDFESALKAFHKLEAEYPLSPLVVDAHYFKVECYYYLRDFKKSLDEIDRMVTLFPLHPLTAYVLLRSGQISEANHQTEEALEIFKTVEKSFPDPEVKKQARLLWNQLESN